MIDWLSKMRNWCCLMIILSSGLVTVSEGAERPNILVILADDLGVMDTELREEGFYETPHLKELAERGMMFTNGYCAHPRCVPSRYAIQTGRFPCRNATNKGAPEVQMKSRTLLAEAFQQNGYATFFAGKWHLGKAEEDWPHNCGYDVNIGGCRAGAPGSYFFPYHVSRKTGKEDKYGPIYALEEGAPDEHITERLTDETEKWIRTTVKGGKPFFAFLSHYAVHTPIEGKPEEVSYFKGKVKNQKGEPYLKKDGQTKMRRDDPHYASMIKTMDESVGQMMALLDELNIADNTVILFSSDHGGLSNRGEESQRGVATSNLPYRAGKGHLYEGGLRVPFVVVYPPMVEASSKTDEVAVGTDIYPTMLALAGLDLLPEEHKDGISLVPALKGDGLPRDRPLIFHSPLPRPDQTGDDAASAIRVGDLKLVKRYFPVRLELYDVIKDPYEEVNLAGQNPEAVKTMRERLERNLVRWESMEPRKNWKDKTVTAPLVEERVNKVGGVERDR
jgi:arylsulfatase A-like enzyme